MLNHPKRDLVECIGIVQFGGQYRGHYGIIWLVLVSHIRLSSLHPCLAEGSFRNMLHKIQTWCPVAVEIGFPLLRRGPILIVFYFWVSVWICIRLYKSLWFCQGIHKYVGSSSRWRLLLTKMVLPKSLRIAKKGHKQNQWFSFGWIDPFWMIFLF